MAETDQKLPRYVGAAATAYRAERDRREPLSTNAPRAETKRRDMRTKKIVRLTAQPDANASEDAIALLFAERHSAELRFVPLWNRWLSWTGCVWHYDDVLATFDRTRAICREMGKRSAK